MTLTWQDIALPIGLALIFAFMRYQGYARAGAVDAVPQAMKDAVKGAIGLSIITLGYKFLISR